MKYTQKEKKFILFKITDMLWRNIPASLKLFWKEKYKESVLSTYIK